MVRRSLIAAAALLALLVSTSLAFARGPGHRGDSLERLERAVGSLELDGETRDAVYAVIDEARAARRADRSGLRDEHEALRGLLEQDLPDPDDVLARVEEIGRIETERRKQGLRTMLAVQALLPETERAALREALDRKRSHGHGFRGKRSCSE